MASSDVPALLRKAAYWGAAVLGLAMVVKLMVDFSAALKPLVTAAMLVACLELWVDLFDEGICRAIRAAYARCRRLRGGAHTELELPLAGQAPGEDNADPSPKEPAVLQYCLYIARPLAVLATLCTVVLAMVTLTMALIQSVLSVDMSVYTKGGSDLEEYIVGLVEKLDPNVRQVIVAHIKGMSSQLGGLIASLLNQMLDAGSGLVTRSVMFLLYVLMWLLAPMRNKGSQHIFQIVRVFFALKAACNMCFAVLAFAILKYLNVDLAILLAALSFVLGFIPEVGALMALLLPVPVVLLDSRLALAARGWKLLWAVGGLLLVKFAVSNGLESVVMGRNPTLAGMTPGKAVEETHPVLVLFAVVLLGEIWGPTGMLVSVPLLSLLRLVINMEGSKEKSSVE